MQREHPLNLPQLIRHQTWGFLLLSYPTAACESRFSCCPRDPVRFKLTKHDERAEGASVCSVRMTSLYWHAGQGHQKRLIIQRGITSRILRKFEWSRVLNVRLGGIRPNYKASRDFMFDNYPIT